MSRAKNWCFTLNNWTDVEYDLIVHTVSNPQFVKYAVIAKEVGESGTPHLQGYVQFTIRKTLATVRALFGTRGHYEVAKGTPSQAADYCKKTPEFTEWGEVPPKSQGKRTDWERLETYVQEHGGRPGRRELFQQFPALMARYEHAIWSYIDSILPQVQFTNSAPRDGWQRELADELDSEPDDRTVRFIVDPNGNSGKTWFCQYMLSLKPDEVQYLRIGRRDDMAHAIDSNKRIFLIDVPRGQMEYLQYSVLEMIKDRMIFSPKYHSQTKLIGHKVHLIVFCNEYPRPGALTVDRVHVTMLSYATVRG